MELEDFQSENNKIKDNESENFKNKGVEYFDDSFEIHINKSHNVTKFSLESSPENSLKKNQPFEFPDSYQYLSRQSLKSEKRPTDHYS